MGIYEYINFRIYCLNNRNDFQQYGDKWLVWKKFHDKQLNIKRLNRLAECAKDLRLDLESVT